MANRKISELIALTAPATGDLLPIVDISEAVAADKNKKITYGELLASAPAGSAAAPSFSFNGDPNSGVYSAGADQVAIATGGTARLTTSTTAVTSTLSIVHPLGAVGTPSITFTGDLNTGIYSPAADTLAFVEGGVEAMRIDSSGRVGIGITPRDTLDINGGIILANGSNLTWGDVYGTNIPTIQGLTGLLGGQLIFYPNGSTSGESARLDTSGRLLVGTSSALANIYVGATAITPQFQLEGNSGSAAALSITRQTGAAANIILQRGVTGTPVTVNHNVGQINFNGHDGTNFRNAAQIAAEVDGTPGLADMPGRLVFSTTADGAATPTERFRITNDGVIAYDQPAPATYAAAATLTVADLKTGIITYTGTAATLTLPTGTLTEGGFSGIYTNMAFEWSVINTGAGICTIGAATAHTIVGSATVAIGASAKFTSRRTAANTFVTYRLA